MSTHNLDLNAWLSNKLSSFLSWLAAAMGIGTVIGIVNITAGVLSAAWLAVQLWNWWTFTRKRNRMELELLRKKIKAAEASCDIK